MDDAMIADRIWFEKHPEATSYVRHSIIGEDPTYELLELDAERTGCVVMTRVWKLAPHVRVRNLFLADHHWFAAAFESGGELAWVEER